MLYLMVAQVRIATWILMLHPVAVSIFLIWKFLLNCSWGIRETTEERP